jgi:hypothetical protein
MTTLESQASTNVPSVLQQVGAELSRERRALLRGDVLGPRGPIFPKRELTALYGAIPVYFPESMQSVVVRMGEETVFVWLVPLHSNEAAAIVRKGWREFEERLAEVDPDLNDLDRPSVV